MAGQKYFTFISKWTKETNKYFIFVSLLKSMFKFLYVSEIEQI